ncbi:VOC family protein [Paenibacillus sp. sptzw28]|uniref:VOC family protein n=1 Tax=Paenibacillus sp. sptzw28 TaxID=715179 RepID=UPI001C6E21D4|nr:VOC family protein [Paenibacillus sp. sptzw28]QYR22433.1 VOC family protein [Paenibacillus sp. sptzw28]
MKSRIHPGTSIGQVKLRVSDLKRSIGFYQNVIGLRLLEEENGSAVMSPDGLRPLLLLQEIPDVVVVPPRRAGAGLYHFALLLPDRKSLGLSLRNLIGTGIHIGQADHLVSEALYIADPDNNGIEIYADRPRDTWRRDASGHYMMATDPIDWDGLLAEAEDAKWEGLPAGTTIGHIHLHVSDLTAAQHFYTEIIGFEIMARMGDSALFISAGGYHHHIGLNTWAGVGAPLTPANAAGLAYYRIDLPDREALEAAAGRLREAGIPVRHEGNTVYAYDPSGIEIHLSALIS